MSLRRRYELTVRWLRFCLALALVGAVLSILVSGVRPRGTVGEIIERNLEQDVQATALFYTDLDRMPEIENRLSRRLRTSSAEPR